MRGLFARFLGIESEFDLWRFAEQAAHADAQDVLALFAPRPQLGDMRARQAGDGVEFYQLRDYQQGDPPARIDWKSSARRDATLVRLRERTMDAVLNFAQMRDAAWEYGGGAGGNKTAPTRAQFADALTLTLAKAALDHGFDVAAQGAIPIGRTDARLPDLLAQMDHLPSAQVRNLVLFISPLVDVEAVTAHLTESACARALVIHLFDPTELDLPFTGSAFLDDRAQTTPPRIDDFETARAPYLARLNAYCADMRAATTALGHHYALVRTDTKPAQLMPLLADQIR